MNGKDIIDVNKITTKYLDVNDNIDMKNFILCLSTQFKY